MDQDLRAFAALRSIASLVNASSDPGETLALVLQAFCRDSLWVGAVIMRVDAAARHVEVVARHDPVGMGPSREQLWALDESPARVALATGAPVIIPDAPQAPEFPGYQREARARGYRTVVVLPMKLPEDAVLAAYSRERLDVSERDVAFLELVVHLGAIAVDKARALGDEQAFAARLRSVLAGNAALLERVLSEGSVPALAALVGEMLPNAFVVVDLTARRLFADRSPWPHLLDDAAWQDAVAAEARGALFALALQSGGGAAMQAREVTLRVGAGILRAAATICPLRVDQALVGSLVVFSAAADLGDLDHLVIDGARFGLSVQLMRAHIRFTAEARNLEDLMSGLLQGTMRPAEIAERAARLDIALGEPARLVVLSPTDPGAMAGPAALEALRAISDLGHRHGLRAAAQGGEIVLHVPTRPKGGAGLQALIGEALDEMARATGAPALAVRSRVCDGIADYPAAFRECLRIVDLGRRFGRSGEVTAGDFGPFPVLMSAVDTEEMRDFVQGLIGDIAAHDDRHGTAFLPTVSAYLDAGCRSQACADALGLHVTTLRYRLGRLRDLFGFVIDTPDQRFALQLALRFRDVLVPHAARSSPSSPPDRRRSRRRASPEP